MKELNNFSERLKFAIKGESDHGFAKRAKISGTVMRRYLSGESLPGLDNLLKIAKASNTSIEWLAQGDEPKKSSGSTLRDTGHEGFDIRSIETVGASSLDSRFTHIPILDAEASAGGGRAVLSENKVGVIQFDRDWLWNNWGLNAKDLFTVPSIGDSMEPIIKSGEFVLCSFFEPQDKPIDGIYVIRLEGSVFVKRLQRLPGNKIKIISANAEYDPFIIDLEQYAEGQMDFAVLGRVLLVHGLRRI